jgi:pimeloyl-ACP methyl ester carboxylesterase
MDLRKNLLADLPVDERRLDLAGIETAVLEGGAGPPVILLHGPGAHAAHWMDVIPGLVATHRVIAPDLPGHGASGTGTAPLSTKRILAWLGALIDETCPSPAALVGHLMGGAIAARYAARAKEGVAQLALVDTFGLADFAPPPDFGLALNRYLAEPTIETHEGLWRYCAFDLARLRERMGARWNTFAAYNVDRARGANMRPALHVMMEELATAIAASELERIEVPVTLIWGRHDLALPLQVAQEASGRQGWPLRIIEGAADDAPVEQPEAFLRELRTVLGS